MPVTITINGGDAAEALHELKSLSGGLHAPAPIKMNWGGPAPLADKASEFVDAPDGASALLVGVGLSDKSQPAVEEPKKGRGRPRKVEAAPEPVPAPEPQPEPVAEAVVEEPAPQPDPEPELPLARTLSHDDVRGALGAYVKTYGMPAAQEDGPALLRKLYPDGSVTKISDIPNTQEDFKKVIAGVEEMHSKNPFGRQEV